MQSTLEARRSITHAQDRAPLKRMVAPLFKNGEQLTQNEFHRRYVAMPDGYCAELIGGVVIVSASAVSIAHSRPLSLIHNLIGHYEVATIGVETLMDTTVVLDDANEVQPDTNLRILPDFGGRGTNADRYIMQAPELVVEVANSTEKIDLNQKFYAYQKNGALEYLVHLVREPALKWFVLKNGNYELLPCDKSGVIRSEAFPGLWLNARALLKRDLRGMLKTLGRGLASPEHAAFCKRLSAAKRKSRKTR